jgi:hypothetical protein
MHARSSPLSLNVRRCSYWRVGAALRPRWPSNSGSLRINSTNGRRNYAPAERVRFPAPVLERSRPRRSSA